MKLKNAPIYPRHTDVHDFEWFERSVELMGKLLLSSLYGLCVLTGMLVAYLCSGETPDH